MDIKIRSETKEDYNIVTEINDLAFSGSGESELIKNLNNTNNFIPDISLVALVDGRIVGHILFYPITIKFINNNFPIISLAPMAVHAEYQRRGIGTKLVNDGL